MTAFVVITIIKQCAVRSLSQFPPWKYPILYFCLYTAAVISQCFSDGDFRLANASTNFTSDGSVVVTGRIEVCSNFSYASLCSQYWDPVDAQVFCENYLNSMGYYSNISKLNSWQYLYIDYNIFSFQCSSIYSTEWLSRISFLSNMQTYALY